MFKLCLVLRGSEDTRCGYKSDALTLIVNDCQSFELLPDSFLSLKKESAGNSLFHEITFQNRFEKGASIVIPNPDGLEIRIGEKTEVLSEVQSVVIDFSDVTFTGIY